MSRQAVDAGGKGFDSQTKTSAINSPNSRIQRFLHLLPEALEGSIHNSRNPEEQSELANKADGERYTIVIEFLKPTDKIILRWSHCLKISFSR